ncbi:hypothetical protein TWF718_006609 [Orbilia javanica]|uniref:C2H2-type domain-containing protein n=1 Tax=Orbilia javanica TaxID=47235 RepID=A0AAN8RCK6_9PEZI
MSFDAAPSWTIPFGETKKSTDLERDKELGKVLQQFPEDVQEVQDVGLPNKKFTGNDESPDEGFAGHMTRPEDPDSYKPSYQCKTCDGRFRHLKDLRRHEDGHERPKKHLCPVEGCERSDPTRGFSRRDNLNDHMGRIHGKAAGGANGTQFLAYKPSDHPNRLGGASLAESDPGGFFEEETGAENEALTDGSLRSNRPLPFPSPLRPGSLQTDRDYIFHEKERLRKKADKAYKKLQEAVEYRSENFQRFVSDLGDVENILQIGYTALLEFINEDEKKVPDNLKSLYCMLHLCYAMSKSGETSALGNKDVEFAKSASEWKGCLQGSSDTGVHEQELFDELIFVMWDEMREAWDLLESSQWKSIFEANYANFDPASSQVDLLDPSLSDLLENDIASSGVPARIGSPLAACPSWKTLAKTLVITSAFHFFRGLQNASNVFHCICSSMVGLTLGTNSGHPQASHVQPEQGSNCQLSLDQRRDVIAFLQGSLSKKLHPVLKATSHYFLSGVVNTIRDLEECTVAFLRVYCVNPHTFSRLLSEIISPFYLYYYCHFPKDLKCPKDAYSSETYVSDRVREEEISLASLSSADSSRSPSECREQATNNRRRPAPTDIEIPFVSQPAQRRRRPGFTESPLSPTRSIMGPEPKFSTAVSQERVMSLRWQTPLTGPATKRRKVLKTLPRAPSGY